MTVAEIIERAAASGVMLAVCSPGRLSLTGNQTAIDRWLDVLRENKTEILVLLQAKADAWAAEDWRASYDERAGIVEFDGGLSRAEAEALAYAGCVSEWLIRNPVRSPSGQCLICGQSEHAHDLLLPFGTETAGHV
jgi:hypothetical protein